jgi:hypothetical protein
MMADQHHDWSARVAYLTRPSLKISGVAGEKIDGADVSTSVIQIKV